MFKMKQVSTIEKDVAGDAEKGNENVELLQTPVEMFQAEDNGSQRLQYAIAFILSILTFLKLGHLSWSGPILLKLKKADLLSPTEISWLVSIFSFGLTFGAILGVVFNNYFGRWKSLLISSVIAAFGSSMLCFLISPTLYITGRLLIGIGLGIGLCIAPVYIGEVSSPNIRGKLNVFSTVSANVAIIFQFTVGAYTSIQLNGIILFLFPIIFFILFYFMPRSPYFLMLKGERIEAKKALQRLKITSNVRAQMTEIEEFIDEQNESQDKFLDLFVNPVNRKAFLSALLAMTANSFSGSCVIVSFSHLLFDTVVEPRFSPENSAIIFSIFPLISTIFGCFVIDRWGRKPVFLISLSGTVLSLFVIGFYFYYVENLRNYPSFLVLSLIIYKFFYAFGLPSASKVFSSEMFSTKIAVMANSLLLIAHNFTRFLMLKSFIYLVGLYGYYVFFWTLGAILLLHGVVFFFYVPETKNQSLKMIQKKLRQ